MWRIQRQVLIFTIYIIIAIAPFAIFAYVMLQRSDTCFDGLQNQDEVGVDCGGVCTLQCKNTFDPIKIKFVKGTSIGGGSYNIFALLENPNPNISFNNVPYNIKAYNKEAQLLVSASGTTNLLPRNLGAVFIPSLKMAQFPYIVDLNFGEYKALKDTDSTFSDNVSSGAWKVKRGANNSLQLVSEIKNKSNKEQSIFEVYAILYDDTKSVYAVGKTIVNGIKSRGETAATFTWGDIKDPANVDFVITQNRI